MRYLSLHGYSDVQLSKLRRTLRFCGLLTLALNTSGALGHRMFGTALVDAVGPALLIGWNEVGPWMLRQIYAVCSPTAPMLSEPRPAAIPSPILSSELLALGGCCSFLGRADAGRRRQLPVPGFGPGWCFAGGMV